MTDFQWLTKDQAAERLQVSTRTIERYIVEGGVRKYAADGGRMVRFRSDEIDGLMKPAITEKHYVGPAKTHCNTCMTEVKYVDPGEEDNDTDTKVCAECGNCVLCDDMGERGGFLDCPHIFCTECGQWDDKNVCTPSGYWSDGPMHVCPWNSNSAD